LGAKAETGRNHAEPLDGFPIAAEEVAKVAGRCSGAQHLFGSFW